ncbi:MAG: DNA primase catalytic subunit PriS [Methanobrevibacter sp.]|nr:DNA primase catalytic subunit PriS [Candidatus Methanovirga aequatorialis]
MFEPSTLKERRQYYREEWSMNDLPKFITKDIHKREFGFDHYGKGPNDRYKTFSNKRALKKFLRAKTPFATYISVAFYNEPRRRQDWQHSELVFDIDAKDIPIRSCNCDNVCETCLNESLELARIYIDTLKGDLGLKNVYLVYSGRGYHIRVLDQFIMEEESELRGEILKYITGADVPTNEIPLGYTNLFINRLVRNVFHMTGKEKIEGMNTNLLKDVIKNRDKIEKSKNGNYQLGLFRDKIGPRRYKNFLDAMARVNLSMVDGKVSIDLKRILRLPSSLHSKVSMKCVEVKNLEKFDPFKYAVPKFVEERKS